MISPTELLVRTADLAEAEGRELRRMTVRVAVTCGFVLGATLMGTAGLALVLGALYMALAPPLGDPAAAALVGVVALALGGLLAWIGYRISR